MAKKVTITIETDNVLLVRRRQGIGRRIWCESCRAIVDFATVKDACRFTSTDAHALRDLMTEDILHAITQADGSTVICLASLLKLRSI